MGSLFCYESFQIDIFRDSPLLALFRLSGKTSGFRLLFSLKLREDKRITPYGFAEELKTSCWMHAGQKTESLAPHSLAQAEAVAFSRDGKSIFAVSEKPSSPVVRYGTAD